MVCEVQDLEDRLKVESHSDEELGQYLRAIIEHEGQNNNDALRQELDDLKSQLHEAFVVTLSKEMGR